MLKNFQDDDSESNAAENNAEQNVLRIEENNEGISFIFILVYFLLIK